MTRNSLLTAALVSCFAIGAFWLSKLVKVEV